MNNKIELLIHSGEDISYVVKNVYISISILSSKERVEKGQHTSGHILGYPSFLATRDNFHDQVRFKSQVTKVAPDAKF